MKVSCITVNWNSTDLCERLLASALRFAPPAGWELIIVDNASRSFDPGEFEKYPMVRVIEAGSNLKYAAGNNLGLKSAAGEYILLVNPDIEFTAGSLDALSDFLDTHPDYAAVCPRLVLPDGTSDKSIRGFPYLLPLVLSFLHIPSSYMLPGFDYSLEQDVLQPMTSSLLIRSSVIRELQGFDEQFPIFFNDVDMLYRAAMNGMKIRYLPQSEMKHIHGGSTKRASRLAMKRESYLSLAAFYKKHFTKRYGRLITGLFCYALRLTAQKP